MFQVVFTLLQKLPLHVNKGRLFGAPRLLQGRCLGMPGVPPSRHMVIARHLQHEQLAKGQAGSSFGQLASLGHATSLIMCHQEARHV